MMPPAPAAVPRWLLQADGLVVSAAGAAALAGSHPVASILGLKDDRPMVILGIACVPYGAWLCWAATHARGIHLRRLSTVIAAANTSWVLASAAILLGNDPALSKTGRRMVAAQAGLVALFAAAEAYTHTWIT